jgi:hypothetical protein
MNSLFEFLLFGLVLGIPGAILRLILHWLERRRMRSSPLFRAWSDLQTELVNMLHHPHPESRELDLLLEKLETFAVSGVSMISDTDTNRLIELLREKADDMSQSQSERTRAEWLLIAIPRAKRERQSET